MSVINEKSLDLLCDIKELNTIVKIRNYINNKRDKIEIKGNEYNYCEQNAKLIVYNDLLEFLNNEIKTLRDK